MTDDENETKVETWQWKPRTTLGRLILEGKMTSIDEVFAQGFKIREPEIVDILLPDMKNKVLDINLVQKQTDAGEKTSFKSVVVVGNYDGFVGLGVGVARQVRAAIEKGILNAKLNITPVRRGCGSWECDCGGTHSLPYKVVGKSGSVRIKIIPGPKGIGIVAGEVAKDIISFAGVNDCWTKSFGSTRTMHSYAFATFNALKNTYRILPPKEWTG